jgi:hypothetical protein
MMKKNLKQLGKNHLNEPQTYNEAIQAPDVNEWIDAMKFELNALDKMHIWETTQLPENRNS